jgi:hypothetical protein
MVHRLDREALLDLLGNDAGDLRVGLLLERERERVDRLRVTERAELPGRGGTDVRNGVPVEHRPKGRPRARRLELAEHLDRRETHATHVDLGHPEHLVHARVVGVDLGDDDRSGCLRHRRLRSEHQRLVEHRERAIVDPSRRRDLRRDLERAHRCPRLRSVDPVDWPGLEPDRVQPLLDLLGLRRLGKTRLRREDDRHSYDRDDSLHQRPLSHPTSSPTRRSLQYEA